MAFLPDAIDNISTFLRLPEVGYSEKLSGGKATTNTSNPAGVNLVNSPIGWGLETGAAYNQARSTGSTGATDPQTDPGGSIGQLDLSGSFGGSGGGAAGPSAADERAYYDDQISNLDRLLGLTNSQRDNGLANLGVQRGRLADSRTKAMNGYDAQGVENGQNKQRGVEQVDQFANNSYNSLQRLLQGGNAGNSSVGRELIPYLISKGAGQRRQGVFDQAGKNDAAIADARGDAETQFKWGEEDLGGQEKNFREGILNKQNELDGQKRSLQIQRAQATGLGYEQARAAGEASQNSINDRMGQLSSLFGQFNPTYRDPNLKTAALGKYTVDPAQIKSDQNLSAESRYYLPQLKRKQDELV